VIPYAKRNARRLKLVWFPAHAGDSTYEAIKRAVFATIAACVFATVPAIAAEPNARDPVALVVEKDGPTIPELQAYSEIMAGDAFQIPSGSLLVFIDYHSCDRVTVSGSTVNFSADGFSTSPGGDRSEQRVPCPQTLAPDSGGENSSVLMRGTDFQRAVATRPTFVIIGAPSRSFSHISVKDGTQTLVDSDLHGARFDWPPSAPPLDADKVYHMVLLPEQADDHPVKLSFRAAEDSPGAQEAIVLIHASR
jgi:hypothetical protein